MDQIQAIISAKIREGLSLCGLSDISDEPIQHEVMRISQYGEFKVRAESQRD